ncbi:acyl-CoA N-acyltransferase [Ganoderma leucocontextum]|nr:acyl-CoA N-acyltransferase [Ganoderma leucocontextum]
MTTQSLDVNFAFPWRDLENNRVKLVPFNPSVHATEYWSGTKDHPEVYDYLPWGPFASPDTLLAYLDERFHRSPQCLVLAVLDKTAPVQPWPLAGLAGFLHADPANLSVEVGVLVCLPTLQRRRVTYAAVALLLQYSLNLPAEGGLGLRRVQYQANTDNDRSVAFAKKIGFRLEGVARWQRVLDGHKPGNGVKGREGDPRAGTVGRDTAVLSMCWDDWEGGKRELICLPEYTLYRS